MDGGDLLGWLAASLTLLTFSTRSMITLRTVAVAASLCFIAYGALSDLYPVLALHLLLLPCNLFRLRQLTRRRKAASVSGASPSARRRRLLPLSLPASREG